MSTEKNNVVLVERELNASASRVFEALKAGRLFMNCGAWLEGTEIDFREGGRYRFNWGHHGNTYGEFTEIVENKRLVFTWNFDEMNVRSRVIIDLISQGERCLLKLRHEGFTDQELAEMHDGGWAEGLSGFSAELLQHRVRIEREYLVPVDMLYQACSGLRFFQQMGATEARSRIDFRIGGRYQCELNNGGELRGEFLEIVPNQRIVFTWESAPCGSNGEKTTQVTMNFGPWGDEGKNSYLELIHEGFTDSESTRSHHEGWLSVLWKVYNQARR